MPPVIPHCALSTVIMIHSTIERGAPARGMPVQWTPEAIGEVSQWYRSGKVTSQMLVHPSHPTGVLEPREKNWVLNLEVTTVVLNFSKEQEPAVCPRDYRIPPYRTTVLVPKKGVGGQHLLVTISTRATFWGRLFANVFLKKSCWGFPCGVIQSY